MKIPATNRYGQSQVPNTFFADDSEHTIYPAFKKRNIVPEWIKSLIDTPIEKGNNY